MGLAQKIIGYVTGNGAEVDAGNNLKTTTPNHNTAASYVGSTCLVVEHDDGSVTGSRDLRSPTVTENSRLSIAQDTLQWHGMFPGSSQNTNKWKYLSSTMTAAQAGDGFITLNNNLTATTGTGCSLQSWKYYTFFDVSTFTGVWQMSITNAQPVANQVLEWGFFIPTATAAPSDGVYFRYTTAGLYGYIKFGANAEVASPLLLAANSLTLNQTYDFTIVCDERSASFYRSGVDLGTVDIPTGTSNIYQTLALPLSFQQRNSGAVSGTQMQAKVSCTSVYQNDLATNEPWFSQLAGIGNNNRGLDGGTMGKLSLWGNSAAPTAVALTNTTAAFTGLGGITAVLPTLAANTDGILINYTNPLGSTTQPPAELYIVGISIHGIVSVALTGGPVCYTVAAAYGHNAVSLATTESASFTNNTTKSPAIVPLGTMSFAATAAVGAASPPNPLWMQFSVPLVVHPGENIAIVLRNIGTVTSAGAITFTVGYDHVFR